MRQLFNDVIDWLFSIAFWLLIVLFAAAAHVWFSDVGGSRVRQSQPFIELDDIPSEGLLPPE